MFTKSMTIKEMDDAGTGLARIAVLSAVDHDGDTYQPGAFGWKAGGSQWAPILPAHNRREIPLGKARVFEDGDEAFAELSLNLETQSGKDWHAALKFDLETGEPVQEWSYGYDTLDHAFDMRGGKKVRVLKRLDIHEVSTVVRGAGLGTGTLAIKSAELKQEHFAPLIAALGELANAVGDDISALSATGLKQLVEIHAGLDKALSSLPAQGQAGEASEKERLAIDSAVASFLRFGSRQHLKG